jgi:WD40 repeat protein
MRVLSVFLLVALPELAAAQSKVAGMDGWGDPLPDGAVARMGTVRFRHWGCNPTHVAWSRDGKVLVSAGGDRTLCTWEAATGKEIARYTGHKQTSWISCLALSHDGKVAASAINDELHLWNPATGKTLRVIANPYDSLPHQGQLRKCQIMSVAFSPDDQVLVAGLECGSVCRWDVATGKELSLWKVGKDYVWSVACSPDGKTIAAGDHKGKVVLWRTADGTKIREFQGIDFLAQGLAFTADSAAVIVGGQHNTILRVWDVASGKELEPFKGPDSWHGRLALSADGKRLVAINRWAAVWDVASRKLLLTLDEKATALNTSGFGGVALSPDGKTLATAGDCVRLWDVASGKPAGPPHPVHERAVWLVAFTPDGKTLLSSGYESDVFAWDAATGKLRGRLQTNVGRPAALAFVPGTQRLVTGGWDGAVRFWDLDTFKETAPSWKAPGNLQRLALANDGKTVYLVTGNESDAAVLRVCDLASGKQHREWQVLKAGFGPGATARADALLLPDARKLIVASVGEVGVQLWDVGGGGAIRRLDDGRYGPHGTALSPDGRLLASVGDGIEVREVATGKVCWTITVNNHLLWAAAFSPDGRYLAVGGTRGLNAQGQTSAPVLVFDLATGKQVLEPPREQDTVYSVAFSPDGKRLATAGEGVDSILVWDLTGVERGPHVELDAAGLQAAWEQLGSSTGSKAFAAVWALVRSPKSAVPFLHGRLLAEGGPAGAPPGRRIAALLAALDARQFTVREKATTELARLGAKAHAALRAALEGPLSEEARQRISRLLADQPDKAPATAGQQASRALQALELIGTQAARDALAALMEDLPTATWAPEARAAWKRLQRVRP